MEVRLVLVLWDERISAEGADAIQWVGRAIGDWLNPEEVWLRDVEPKSDEEMSVAEYFRSAPIFFDYLTSRGEEIVGTEPFGPA
jgi:hypothetical protein